MYPVDADDVAAIRSTPLSTAEASALVERYLEGDCLTFAFAVHWMTGWPVEAASEEGKARHLHFAAVSPDGMAWDAAGPRSREESGMAYGERVIWEPVDAMRLIATQAGVDEDAITAACHDAIRLLAPVFGENVARLPDISPRPAP